MKKTIKYKIAFFSDWHCGSGLSAGVDLDLLVIKDKNHLPFIPGKTIKGLVREAVEEINSFMDAEHSFSSEKINTVFGEEARLQGCAFFKNAELPNSLKGAIVDKELQNYLYRSVASSAINDGIAVEHSLRKVEVTVPCTLEGEILCVPEDLEKLVLDGLKMIKRLGQNRNRGLGRCQIIVEE